MYFPLGYKDSFTQWWRATELKVGEEELLKYGDIDVHTNPHATSIDVPIGSGLHINELRIEGPKVENRENKHTVLIHGYGAAKGLFYRNLVALGTIPGYTLHALDLLGYGRSSRPRFHVKATDLKDGVSKAEMFFTDSLESWRRESGIPKFTLLAHSLGAYIGCAYAIQYPDRVEKLALLSPAGVNRTPESIPAVELGIEDPSTISARTVQFPTFIRWGWNHGLSLFSFVRAAGPLGPKLSSAWVYRRAGAAGLPDKERDAIQTYVYGIFSASGSGEYALRHLLGPGAQSRWPLCERVNDLKCSTLWVYGEKDWMDISGGHEAAQRLKRLGRQAEVVSIKQGGHHMYLDNPSDFNDVVINFITTPATLWAPSPDH